MLFLCSNYLIPAVKYGHPNKEIIDNLNDSKIYRTDKDGEIVVIVNEKSNIKIDKILKDKILFKWYNYYTNMNLNV